MQRLSSVLAGVLVVALFAGPSARPAQASDSDKLTYVTFSGPVEPRPRSSGRDIHLQARGSGHGQGRRWKPS